MKPTKLVLILFATVIGYFTYPYLSHFFSENSDSPPQSQPTAIRPIPSAQPAPTQTSAFPTPIFQGGGSIPLSHAIPSAKAPLPQMNPADLPWVPLTSAPFAKPSLLSETSFFMVLRPSADPEIKTIGILAASGRPWDNFYSIQRHENNSLGFQSENASGGAKRSGVKRDLCPAPGEPMLLEFHTDGKGSSQISINGKLAGSISDTITANYFGQGYATAPKFKGEVGEIRAYPTLTPEQRTTISSELMDWWHITPNESKAFPYRYASTTLTPARPSTISEQLSLQLLEKDQPRVHISATADAPPIIADLPDTITAALARNWHLHFPSNQTTALAFTFDPKTTLSTDYLGTHGFYALLHRATKDQAWKEVSTTIRDTTGLIHFNLENASPGDYALAVVQGEPMQQNPAQILVNGSSNNGFQVESATPFTLTCRNSISAQTLTLTDQSNQTWYRGPAEKISINHRLLSTDSIQLNASFSAAKGTLPGTQTLTLNIDPSKPTRSPGLLAQITKASNDLQKATWPSNLKSQISNFDYPAFRTAESIHTPPFDKPVERWYQRPDYFHLVLLTLNITSDGEKIISQRASHRYPLGDVSSIALVNLRINGEILTDQTGDYIFKFDSNLPGSLNINGKSTTVNETLTLTLSSPSNIPLEINLTNSKETPTLSSQLLWKTPKSDNFVPIPASQLVHTVAPSRLAALRNLNPASTPPTIRAHKDDSETVALLENFDPVKITAKRSDYIKTCQQLLDAYLHGNTLANQPKPARALFSLIHAYSDVLRSNPGELRLGTFAKTNGDVMRQFVSLRPFFTLTTNHPALQQEALLARAELAKFAVATCLNRSSFSETHSGANDGYNDDNNLLANFWRAAEAIDSPYAWDAAAMLMDSHFRFTAGGAEGLQSDGIFGFHHANGRHVHMNGYGQNWFSRVIQAKRHHTPWAYTPEQYRRLAEYALAYEWIVYQNTQTFCANGRHNTHSGSSAQATAIAKSILGVPADTMHPADRTNLENMVKRIKDKPNNSIIGNRFFYRNLLTIHRREDYYIDLKMISPMAGPLETFAGHRPWNMSFGDGVTTLMRTGTEYQNIHRNIPSGAYSTIRPLKEDANGKIPEPSLWLYRQLPGTTQLDDELYKPDRYRKGSGSTAGGVSDGSLGHAAFHFRNGRTGSDVRKFYAFTDDGMLVLNSGITTTRKDAPKDVHMRSTINQCDAQSDVTISYEEDGKISTNTYPLTSDDLQLSLPLDRRIWVSHTGIGYLIEPTTDHQATLELSFAKRNPLDPVPGFTFKDAQLEKMRSYQWHQNRVEKIFHLGINHGQQVNGASCAYYITMRADKANPEAWLKSPPVEILSNSIDLQACRDTRDQTVQAFFRTPGALKSASGKELISSPNPLAIMWRPANHTVTVQDPTAACTHIPANMQDTLKFTIQNSPFSIPMPGTNDPDDRYRGTPVTKSLPNQ